MLILLDIGNTAVTYGIYKGGRLLRSGSCIYNDIPKIVKKCLISGYSSKINVIISSVVPKITKSMTLGTGPLRFPGPVPKVKIWVVGRNLPVKIKHRYQFSKLGVDRAVNIYGALRIYKAPFLIIDSGTAITFDYVSKQGVFEGGMIVPGPEVSLQALMERAALLPKNILLPKKAASFLGRTTYDCMVSGILEGYGALTDGLIERFRKRYGKSLKVIATGGFMNHLKPYTRQIDVVDLRHSVKSLLLLAKTQIFT